MNVNEIWQREIAEENRYREYQLEIERANQNIRELTDESEFYVSVYEFFTEGIPHTKIDCDQSALIQSKKNRVEACRKQIEELQGRLVGENEQETRLFLALANSDMETIRQLAEDGMTRAMFYHACSEALKGNLQISRFKEIKKKEEPYSSKAEMVILANEVEELRSSLDTVSPRVDAVIRETTERLSADEQRSALQRQLEYYDRLKDLQKDAKKQKGKLKDFVNNRLSTATDHWSDSDFLDQGTSLETDINTLLDRLERSNDEIRTGRRRLIQQNPLVVLGKILAVPALFFAIVLGANAWVNNNYEGARVYVEFEKNPRIVFQYETEADKNRADIPEKILFFETEATTRQMFQYGK